MTFFKHKVFCQTKLVVETQPPGNGTNSFPRTHTVYRLPSAKGNFQGKKGLIWIILHFCTHIYKAVHDDMMTTFNTFNIK
jgi:hypothetical protein